MSILLRSTWSRLPVDSRWWKHHLIASRMRHALTARLLFVHQWPCDRINNTQTSSSQNCRVLWRHQNSTLPTSSRRKHTLSIQSATVLEVSSRIFQQVAPSSQTRQVTKYCFNEVLCGRRADCYANPLFIFQSAWSATAVTASGTVCKMRALSSSKHLEFSHVKIGVQRETLWPSL